MPYNVIAKPIGFTPWIVWAVLIVLVAIGEQMF